jgi:murein DD-endopeptidase MepM/ murein hydrolase activator NlpD
VYAVATGEVVFAGSDYPGRVVIVRHADDLFSKYGHLDYALAVGVGDVVERGQPLGTILARTDGRAPSHLHFEIRTFLTTPEVNGDSPRYGFACGVDCPPGPGYWPIDAPVRRRSWHLQQLQWHGDAAGCRSLPHRGRQLSGEL